MAVGVLGGAGIGNGSPSFTVYAVPAGISYAVVHVYFRGPAAVAAGGTGIGQTSSSLVLGTGQGITAASTAAPLSFGAPGRVLVTGYEVP